RREYYDKRGVCPAYERGSRRLLKVSLLIPVYNEGAHLERFLTMLAGVPFNYPVEYIIVDDCSRDDSWTVIERWREGRPDGQVKTFRQPHNRGKGAALHKAIELATGDI